MIRIITIALFLLALAGWGAQAQPNKVVDGAAYLVLYGVECGSDPTPKTQELIAVITEAYGESAILGAVLRLNDTRKKVGNERWCAVVREKFRAQIE
jgi:hypothetical protein